MMTLMLLFFSFQGLGSETSDRSVPNQVQFSGQRYKKNIHRRQTLLSPSDQIIVINLFTWLEVAESVNRNHLDLFVVKLQFKIIFIVD